MTVSASRLTRWFAALLLACVWSLGMAPRAAAHNTLAASDPAAGVSLSVPPSKIVLTFVNPVPLDSATVEVIDATGRRLKITGLAHGPQGDTQVAAELPQSLTGAVTVRWRLVGPDGHPISGRVPFTLTAGTSVAPARSPPATSDFDDPWRVPRPLRWAVRWISYLALVVLGGILAAAAWLLPACWERRRVQQAALAAAGTIGVLGGAHLLMLAGDIAGVAPFKAWGTLGGALATPSGGAFAVRLVGAIGMVGVLTRPSPREQLRWRIAAGLFLLLLGSWAFAGHGGSMRWAFVGVPLDVAHHAAAVLWLGGLVVVGRLGLGRAYPDHVLPPLQRFVRLAPLAVGTLAATGLLQTIRLTGIPDLTLSATHTRLLVLKIVLLAVMLKVADINRRRVLRRFGGARQVTPRFVGALRRAMALELVIGVVILAVTAAMVVSPPPVAASPVATERSGLIVAPTTDIHVRDGEST